jgi:hypothetical protein
MKETKVPRGSSEPGRGKHISFLAFTVATQNPLLVSEMKNQMIAQLSSLVGAKRPI